LDNDWQSLFQVFPNPSSGQVRVEFPETPDRNSQLVLQDMRGAVLKEWTLDVQTAYDFDLSGISKGYYLLQVRTESQQYRTVKLIIQ
ncbi:MAG: T9SS type A sorting domain-containing protein, partial [Bacteroidota bacterium]